MISTNSQIQIVETEMKMFRRRYPDHVGFQSRWIDAYFTLRERLDKVENPKQDPPYGFVAGALEVNFTEEWVAISGQRVHFTPKQFSMLKVLVRYYGQVVTFNKLLEEVWGPEYTDERTYIKVFISRIRIKIHDDPVNSKYIFTYRGSGYMFRSTATIRWYNGQA